MQIETLVEWRNRQINTLTSGTGPAVVMSHGTPFSSRVWDPVVPHIDDRHTVHRWDMPGYGRSSRRPDHAVDLDTQAAALTALVNDQWRLERPSVVAHDIGGAVAVRAHLMHGLEMARLVLVDAVLLQPWGSPFYALAQRHADVFQQLPHNMHRALLDTYLSGATRRDLTVEELKAISAPWLGAEGQAAFYRQINQVRREHTDDLADRLDAFRCPVHVIWGADDAWLPIDNGRSVAAAFGVDLIEIAGAGHLVQYDQPAQLATHLNALLRS